MSNTVITKEKQSLKALRREKGTDNKSTDFVGIHIHGGRIVISDYSEKDDRNTVLAILGALGLEPKVETESWCG
jgi:hypothetical protein